MKIICSVKDTAIQAYGQIFLQHTPEEAIRSLTREVNSGNNNSSVAQHPDDHELYKVGEWNEITGELYPNEEGPELIIRLKDLKKIGA